jgi:uncharacterized membrane protein YfcA
MLFKDTSWQVMWLGWWAAAAWILYLFLIGAAGAVLGSIVGLGGGIVIVPALVWVNVMA